MERLAFIDLKTRTIVATLVAAGAVAAGTIAPAASATGCSNRAFQKAGVSAVAQRKKAIGAAYVQDYALAAADAFSGWLAMINARVPCNSRLRNVRTHLLRNLADLWRSYTATAAGDMADGLSWLAAASQEAVRANAGFIFNREVQTPARRFVAGV